ncbi:hypothetical protein [Pseudaquabacterium pictum]|uniref:Uncharacterized protein n=1 Tax=Pseudaquabacterium pictum TaxID=2315236 RepID=A0A480ASA1_9BURK|nr:hypothetical protein [Rubrivivax pictus]GCL62585.1 hypothetical protein AQPW35_16660 [Rubrivivax pictus]
MLFRPSERTKAHFRRGNWLFFPLWVGTLLYIWAGVEGAISREWDNVFFPVFGILFAANFVYGVVGLTLARQDATKSQHPDQDVAALIDGEIDIGEYRKRKENVDQQ